ARAAAVCHRAVLDRKCASPFLRPPLVTGHEFAGEGVEAGPGAGAWRPGDRVTALHRAPCGECPACRAGEETHCRKVWQSFGLTIDGSYAEEVLAPAGALVRLPDALGFREAAPLMCTAGVALHALRRVGGLRAGESVLVTGASGGVGHAGVQLAKRLGARVLAVTSSAAKEPALRAAGPDDVVAPT